MANVTTTTAANFIPEMWRDAILDYAERKFELRNKVLDFSSMVANGGDILNIPKISEETAAAKSADTAVTYSANTDGVIPLSVAVVVGSLIVGFKVNRLFILPFNLSIEPLILFSASPKSTSPICL